MAACLEGGQAVVLAAIAATMQIPWQFGTILEREPPLPVYLRWWRGRAGRGCLRVARGGAWVGATVTRGQHRSPGHSTWLRGRATGPHVLKWLVVDDPSRTNREGCVSQLMALSLALNNDYRLGL